MLTMLNSFFAVLVRGFLGLGACVPSEAPSDPALEVRQGPTRRKNQWKPLIASDCNAWFLDTPFLDLPQPANMFFAGENHPMRYTDPDEVTQLVWESLVSSFTEPGLRFIKDPRSGWEDGSADPGHVDADAFAAQTGSPAQNAEDSPYPW